MLQIHYFCCRNSLCKVLEKAAVWPDACLAVLTRSQGLGLCSVPAHGHLGPASLGPWPALEGLPGSGWVPGGQAAGSPFLAAQAELVRSCGEGMLCQEGSGAELEGHSVTAVTHACDRNALLALSLCPGSCPAARGDPAGPCAPAAARPWHPQPRVPCGSIPAPPAPLLQRGLMPPLPKSRNPPSPPAALKHAVFCPGAQDLLPAPLCSPSPRASPCSLRASRSSRVPGGGRELREQPQPCSAPAQRPARCSGCLHAGWSCGAAA